MKTLFGSAMAVALLGSMMLTGGCVSKKEYDDLAAANRRAQDMLRDAQEALQALRAENQKLVADLQAKEAALAAANDKNALLEQALAKLQSDFDKLKAAYDALLAGQGAAPPPTALPEDLNAELEQLAKDNGWTFDKQRGMVKLSSDLTFEKGSDVVLPTAKEALDKFAKIMTGPKASKYCIYVAGHTDDLPILKAETKRRHPNNWYLSVHRAVSVEEVLANSGMAANRIGAMGFGEYHPVAPNATGHKGNSANRRVEIWIVPPEKFLVLPMLSGATEAPVENASAKKVENAPAEE